MRILYSRDDGSEYLFLRPGAPVCLSSSYEEQLPVRFTSREEAGHLLRRLARGPAALSALRSLLPANSGSTRLVPGVALRHVAELLWRGQLVLHRRRYVRNAYFLERATGSPPPASAAPTPRPTQIEEHDMFSPSHDASAQAAALRDAAQAGVPFCEECQKRQ